MHKSLEIETKDNIFQIQFGQIQFEITGRCNLKCRHCRAAGDLKKDVEPTQIEKIMRFARMFSPTYAEVIISGGEPTIHREFPKVMEIVRENGGESVTLTTNGFQFDKNIISLLRKLAFKKLMLSISLDSLNSTEHDAFRGRIGAHQHALKAIDLMVEAQLPNTVTSVRVTLKPEQIPDMETMANFVFKKGCQRVNFSSIHPSGRAINDSGLWMNLEQMRQFITAIFRLQKKYRGSFTVSTNDPLKCLLRKNHDIGSADERVFDGCAAGAVTFNVNANGDMTPCALMNLPIMNTRNLSVEQITQAYKNSGIIHNLLEMNLKGKCGSCELKFQCGGCRARALTRLGNYLEEDPCCWR